MNPYMPPVGSAEQSAAPQLTPERRAEIDDELKRLNRMSFMLAVPRFWSRCSAPRSSPAGSSSTHGCEAHPLLPARALPPPHDEARWAMRGVKLGRSTGPMRWPWLLVIATALACRRSVPRGAGPLANASASVTAPAASSVPDGGDGDPPPRAFFPAKDVSDDTGYLWKEGSGYRVTLLFDQHGRSKNKGRPSLVVDKSEPAWDFTVRRVVTFGEQLFDGLRACRTSAGEIALGYRHEDLALSWRGAHVGTKRRAECQKDIATQRFYAEGRDYDDERGFTFRSVRTDVRAEVGVARITYQGSFCQDTGRHHVELRGARGRIMLRDMLTVELFEEDLDGDGAKELYVMSEQACSGWLRVVRVVAEK